VAHNVGTICQARGENLRRKSRTGPSAIQRMRRVIGRFCVRRFPQEDHRFAATLVEARFCNRIEEEHESTRMKTEF
jgi:hypothetical protein